MSDFNLDMKNIRKLAELLKESGLNEIEYAEGDKRIRCARFNDPAPAAVQYAAAPVAVASAPVAAAAPAPQADAAPVAGTVVNSPMVGTVYMAPEPGAPAFIKVGDKVKQGDTLLIIEAMKVMNPIKASVAGTILEIKVADASPVEFGEPLVLIG